MKKLKTKRSAAKTRFRQPFPHLGSDGLTPWSKDPTLFARAHDKDGDMQNFLALDFETANYDSSSACSIGLVRVENGEIVAKDVYLIRPPSRAFTFTYIHGLTWSDVAEAPTFAEIWPRIRTHFDSIEFVAAHNAGFDRKVLNSCCDYYGIARPDVRFSCSVQLARKTWGIYPTKLSDVCRHLGIDLNHHEALSDALACARIVLAASHLTA